MHRMSMQFAYSVFYPTTIHFMRFIMRYISMRLSDAEMEVFADVAARKGGIPMTTMIKTLVFDYAKENKLQTYMALFPSTPKNIPQPPQFPRDKMKTQFMKDEETAKHITELLDDPPPSFSEDDLVRQYGCSIYDLNDDWNTYRRYRREYKTYHNIPLTELDIKPRIGGYDAPAQQPTQQPTHHTTQDADYADGVNLDLLFDD